MAALNTTIAAGVLVFGAGTALFITFASTPRRGLNDGSLTASVRASYGPMAMHVTQISSPPA